MIPATTSATPSVIARWKWGVVFLLFAATLINYMDRQTVQATSTHVINEFFGGKEEGFGRLESAFGYAFGISMLIAGFLVDRYRVRWIYVTALLVWSAAGICTGFTTTVEALILCRVVLGFAESFNWPCAVSIIGRILPQEARGLANGFFHSGASLGAALTPILAYFMIRPDGSNWRSLFLVIGATGCLWAFVWCYFIRGQRAVEIERKEEPSSSVDDPTERLSFFQVMTLRTFWITMMVSVTVNVCWHFFRSWLPRILKKDLHYTQSEMLWMTATFFVAADVGCTLAGYASRRLTRCGYTVERSRKIVSTCTSILCLCAIPVAYQPAPWLAIPLVLVVAAGALGGFANMFSLAQEMAPGHTAKVVAIISCVPWVLLAMLNPAIGRLADESGTFSLSVTCMAFVPLLGTLIGWAWPERPRLSHG